MAWIEIHQSLRDHRKILALADRLSMPEPHIAGHLVYLWLWSLDNAPDGKLPNAPRFIARASGWEGDPQEWVDALIAVKLLDRERDGLYIHDYYQYVEKLIKQRESNRERQAAWRLRQHALDENRNGDITVTSQLSNPATVPTVPTNTTKPIFAPNAATAAPSRKNKTPKAEPTPRPRNPWFDAYTDAMHCEIPRNKAAAWALAFQDIASNGMTPDDVPKLLAAYAQKYPDMTPSPMALQGNLPYLKANIAAMTPTPTEVIDYADLRDRANQIANELSANGHRATS